MRSRFVPVSLIFAAVLMASRAEDVVLDITHSVQVQFKSEQGKTYQVFATPNAEAVPWTPIGEAQAGTGGTITFFYNSAEDQKLFFKVESTLGGGQAQVPEVLRATTRLV